MTTIEVKHSSMFDDGNEADNLYELPIREGLSSVEMQDAKLLKPVLYGTWGIYGPPGSGKDTVSHTIAFKAKRYFGKKVLLDHKPRSLFGDYTFFDARLLMNDVKQMAAVSGIDTHEEDDEETKDKKMTKAIDSWIGSKEGEVLLKNGFLVLGELKNYLHNRYTGNPLGKLISRIITVRRHLDLIVVGTTPFENEIDHKGWVQYVSTTINCEQMMSRPHTFIARISARGMMTETAIISNVICSSFPYYVDGKEPRSCLGLWITNEGRKKLTAFSILSEFEKKVLQQFQLEKILTIDKIMEMTNWNVDDIQPALERLIKFKYLDGYGYFNLFNSKNYTNLQPKLGK